MKHEATTLALGTGGAALAVRAMDHVVFGVAPLDPAAFLVAPLVLVVVAEALCAE